MAGRFSDVELEWIYECLDQHGEYVVDLLTEEIEKRKLIKSEELIDSVQAKIVRGNNPRLELSFLGYGRAIEIKYHRRNLRQFEMPNTNAVVWGMRENRSKKRKDTRWYAKPVYGTLNRLIGIIGNELGDAEIERMKRYLENRKNYTII